MLNKLSFLLLFHCWQVFAEFEENKEPEVALMGRDGGGFGVNFFEKGDRVVESALDVVEAELFPETQGVTVGFQEQEQVAVQVDVRERGGMVTRQEWAEQEVLGGERQLQGWVIEDWGDQGVLQGGWEERECL